MALEKIGSRDRSTFDNDALPMVEIKTYGDLKLKATALRAYGLEDFTHCVRYFDLEERTIYLDFVAEDHPDESKVRVVHTRRLYYLTIRPLLHRYNLSVTETLVAPLRRDAATGFYAIPLNEAITLKEHKERLQKKRNGVIPITTERRRRGRPRTRGVASELSSATMATV